MCVGVWALYCVHGQRAWSASESALAVTISRALDSYTGPTYEEGKQRMMIDGQSFSLSINQSIKIRVHGPTPLPSLASQPLPLSFLPSPNL